ncbi:hypothetical protein ACI0X9_003388 [Cronobacter turicensis]
MFSSFRKAVLPFFTFLVFVSFSTEAGYKGSSGSSFKSYSSASRSSSVRSSYSSRGSSSASQSPSSSVNNSSASKQASTGSAKPASVATQSTGSNKPASKASATGSLLAAKKGTISTSNNSTSKSKGNTSSATRNQDYDKRNYSWYSNAAPSENMRTIIRERSGTNWTTLALMYWMLSSHNSQASSLSSDDRAWVKQQIQDEESHGANHDEAIKELKASGIDTEEIEKAAEEPKHHVVFIYDAPNEMTAGKIWMFTVIAKKDGKQEVPVCTLDGAETKTINQMLFVSWKAPDKAGVKSEIHCKAFGEEKTETLETK